MKTNALFTEVDANLNPKQSISKLDGYEEENESSDDAEDYDDK